jgi:polar amino acid transport system substrate-binding protein
MQLWPNPDLRFFLRSVLCLAFCAVALPSTAREPLRLCFEDVPQAPWTMPDGTGLNFELLNRAAKLAGERFVYRARPWTRCQEEARTGMVDGMIGVADSPERRGFSLPPLGANGQPDADKALYQDRVEVFVRRGSGAQWDGKQFTLAHGSVVAQRGYFVVDLLRQRGLKVHDTIKSSDEGLRMLAAGSADIAVLLSHDGAGMVQGDARFRDKIDVAKAPFVVFPFFLMIARKAYSADPARIEAIWNAVRAVRASAEYRKLEAMASNGAPH